MKDDASRIINEIMQITKVLSRCINNWGIHCFDPIVKFISNMNSKVNIKYHLFFFKTLGLWPNLENGSVFYKIWSFMFCTFLYFGLPASHLVCVLFVGSVELIVDNLVLTSTVIMASIKAFNVLAQKRKFDQLLETLQKMDCEIIDPVSEEKLKKITKESHLIYFVFILIFSGAYINCLTQALASPPEQRIWSSTYLIPSDFLHRPKIYIGVLVYQIIANWFLCTLSVSLDTYGAILLHTLAGHVDALGYRLHKLGNDGNRRLSNADNKLELVKICKNYVNLLT